MKVVTICGSMKFKKQMIDIAYDLEIVRGFCVIQCVYDEKDREMADKEMKNLVDAHWKKIDISDAINVVNIGAYIGQSTRNEIDYAMKHGKEVLFHETPKEN